MLQKLLLLSIAGAAGTLSRYGLVQLVNRFSRVDFPLGTMAVNVVGCLVAGVILAVTESRLSISPQAKAVILVGFMGAFTTFSAFIADTGKMVKEEAWIGAFSNILLQNVVGILALFLGLYLGNLLFGVGQAEPVLKG